jgi:hypothetical protein
MKDSIYNVPIAKDFIDLEHLLHISPIVFHSAYEKVSVELKYMFRKDAEIISVRARDLFTEEERGGKYHGYKLNSPTNFSAGNELGQEYMKEAIKRFEEKVRLLIYNAWNDYRNSKIKI